MLDTSAPAASPFPLGSGVRPIEPCTPPTSRKVRAHNGILLAAIAYYALTGAPVMLLQAAINGTNFDAFGGFLLFAIARTAKDLMRLLPLIGFRSTRYGIFHPLILMLSLWPIILYLPLIDTNFAALLGLVFGVEAQIPIFLGSGQLSDTDVFLTLAKLELLEALGLLTIIFVFSMLERHFHGPGRVLRQRAAPIYAPERLKLLIMAAVTVSALVVIAFVQIRGGLGSHLGSLALGRLVALQGAAPIVIVGRFGLVAVLVWVCFDPRVARTPWFMSAVCLMAAIVFIIAGSRGDFMLAIISPALCWAVRMGRFPTKLAMIGAPALLLAYGALLMLRINTSDDQRAGLSVYDRLTTTQVSDFYGAGQGEAETRAQSRGGAPVLLNGYAMSGGPLYGRSYAAIFTWFIPRAIWPDKPRGIGNLYAQYFLGATAEGTSVPIGVAAEAYWNFWIPGIFLIYGLFGLIIFWVHRWFLIYGASPFVAVAFVRFITDFSPHAESVVPYIHTLIAIGVLNVLARLFAGYKAVATDPVPR